ncbi:4-hydroxy-4-methyl-2-oxoglutarate aldolase [Novosphingobium chloroacetimidivorans]|uniref:Putative 4-hydroxy-4-methyl-2-oxoglutarate aldolase n=1 Tax=Novosphingobium chloroacetimidivorans TaxID=1428314 RepID=A0A7W7KA20_9SPHN|nr:dimethylmenaquinone methyltransferase [Novosphingobium chloroacetimidivorans]MBB4858992.1 4-hydroxy-4-methyl-2-oxoglutarate aldolase [Novosphingobium chloroacetimidivorans]
MRPLKSVVYKRIPRPDPALIERARKFGIADLHEGLGAVAGRMCLMSPRMQARQNGQGTVVGPAITAWNYPGDNLAIHCALEVAQAGDVLVLTNGGGHQGALWGDVACGFAKKQGLVGTVVEGAARDIDAIRELGFPIWSTAVSVEHPEKRGPAAVNVPLTVDGVLVEPGDVVCADTDGVLIIPRALLRHAVEGAEKRARAEVGIRARIEAGERPFDILGFREAAAEMGLEIKDCSWQDDA